MKTLTYSYADALCTSCGRALVWFDAWGWVHYDTASTCPEAVPDRSAP